MLSVVMNLNREDNVPSERWYPREAVNDVSDWFLMDNPWAVLATWGAYMAFVLWWGPSYMAKRQPFKLRTVLILYNVFQVALSFYIFQLGGRFMYNWGVLTSECFVDKKITRPTIMDGIYVYLLAKISELLDTVFFVLRKKNNQVTFLHLYHHSVMMLGTWTSLKYNPTDAFIFLGTVNSLVHVVMYGYYGLSAFPSLTKYLWWKKYITTMQLVQFGMMMIHITIGTFVSNCQTSHVLLYTMLFNCGLMIYLFRDFYNKAYKLEKCAPTNGTSLKKQMN